MGPADGIESVQRSAQKMQNVFLMCSQEEHVDQLRDLRVYKKFSEEELYTICGGLEVNWKYIVSAVSKLETAEENFSGR